MRRKAIYIIIAVVTALAIAGIALGVVLSLSSDIHTDKDGNTVLTTSSIERVQTVMREDYDSLVINLVSSSNQEDKQLIDSKGRSRLAINGNGASFNISVISNARETVLSNITVLNSRSDYILKLTGSNPAIILDNITLRAYANSASAVLVTSKNAKLTIKNSVLLQAGDGAACQNGGTALVAENLTIEGSGSLVAKGGKAGAGVDGTKGTDGISYSTECKTAPAFEPGCDGAPGGAGQNGGAGVAAGQGGDALTVDSLTVKGYVSLSCYGGDAQRSGNGGAGGNGGNGQGATRAQLAQFASYQGGRGGDAGSGGDGADETRPGCGIVSDSLTIETGAKVTCKAGAKGTAGKGAAAGSPGKGGESSGGSTSNWGGYGTASGGNQGKAGADGASIDASEIQDYIVQILVGTIY